MSNVQVVQQAMAAIRSGDLDAARDVVAPDFVWHIPGRSSISGDAAGAEAWSANLGRLLGAGLQPAMLGMLEDDQRVVALQHKTAQSGGHSLDVQVVNVFAVTDGKVRRLDTYFSDQYAVDAFWSAVLA